MSVVEREPSTPLAHLRQRLTRARGLNERLAFAVVDAACPLYPGTNELGTCRRVRDLIAAQAWLDLAVLLLAWRLPRWRARQVYWEDGVWHCVLTLAWTPAPWLGRPLVAAHPALECALLLALVEGLERGEREERPLANVVPLRPSRGMSSPALPAARGGR